MANDGVLPESVDVDLKQGKVKRQSGKKLERTQMAELLSQSSFELEKNHGGIDHDHTTATPIGADRSTERNHEFRAHKRWRVRNGFGSAGRNSGGPIGPGQTVAVSILGNRKNAR